MIKLFMSLILCVCSYTVLFAQEIAIAKVHYQFVHINDTNLRDQPQRDEVVTYLGKNSSFYTTYSDVRVKEDISAQKLAKDYTGHLSLKFSNTPTKYFYVVKPIEKQLLQIEAISSSFDAYQTEIAYEEQDWKIYDELKVIGGYNCQKAVTNFKGRKYIAWFTTDLPFPFGPWKLHGLPGLILSAEDDLQEVSFQYLGFDKLQNDDVTRIEPPSYTIRTSQYEIDKLKKVFNEDASKYYGVLGSSGRMSIVTNFYGIDYSKNTIDLGTQDGYDPSLKMNNPIEKVK